MHVPPSDYDYCFVADAVLVPAGNSPAIESTTLSLSTQGSVVRTLYSTVVNQRETQLIKGFVRGRK